MTCRRYLTLLCTLCIILGCPLSALAQSQGTQGDHFLHRVRPADTLSALALHYTGRLENWRLLRTHNKIANPSRLSIGLVLRIPLKIIPMRVSQAALIHVSGTVWVNDQPSAEGQTVPEGSRVRTDADGFATLSLEDRTTVTILAESTATLDRLRVFEHVELGDTVVQVHQGSVESDVAPEGEGVGRFEVRTPVSVTGVRGTKIRVHVGAHGATTEVLSGVAHVSGKKDVAIPVQASQGVRVDADGKISAVQTLLPPPVLHATPDEGNHWLLAFDPIAGAQSYLVQVFADAEGARMYANMTVTEPQARVQTYDANPIYVRIRAEDAHGIGGHSTMIVLTPRAVPTPSTTLRTTYGDVRTSFDTPVQLIN